MSAVGRSVRRRIRRMLNIPNETSLSHCCCDRKTGKAINKAADVSTEVKRPSYIVDIWVAFYDLRRNN